MVAIDELISITQVFTDLYYCVSFNSDLGIFENNHFVLSRIESDQLANIGEFERSHFLFATKYA
jgi:hypothetical protein